MDLTAQNKPERKNRRESRRALAISIALHMLVGAGLIRVLLMPNGLRSWLRLPKEAQAHVEHLRYVALPPAPPQPSAGHAAPKSAHVTPPPAGPTVVAAPTTVPTTLPPAPSKTAPPAEVQGVGPVAATGGPGQGARFEYHGPGVYVPPAPPGTGERQLTANERLDSAAHAITGHYNDSVMALGPTRQPGDWTKTIGGKKWGMDQQYIHLGPIAIPNAILAALPLNTLTDNPIAAANEKLINYRSADIAFQRNKQLDDEEFHKAVKEERLRKEREHEQKKKDQQNQTPTVAQQQGNPPPTQ